MARRSRQLELKLPTWGGKREGAGRKAAPGKKAGVPHRQRIVDANCPLHVTLRVRRGLPRLRSQAVWQIIRPAFEAGRDRFGFRLNQYSVQGNHLHLVVEANDRRALARGLKGLCVRLARGLNRLANRHGAVFNDRYHSRPLRTPTEVRNCLGYVLHNDFRHHGGRVCGPTELDPYSSAPYFDGWEQAPVERPQEPPPVALPRTWLLRVGWRRLGLL